MPEILDAEWHSLALRTRGRPETLERLALSLGRAVEEPGLLAELPDDEAWIVARLANLGLGELLMRANGHRR